MAEKVNTTQHDEIPMIIIETFLRLLTKKDRHTRPADSKSYLLTLGDPSQLGIIFLSRPPDSYFTVYWWLIRNGLGVRTGTPTANQNLLKNSLTDILMGDGLNPEEFCIENKFTGVSISPTSIDKPPHLDLVGIYKSQKLIQGVCGVKVTPLPSSG